MLRPPRALPIACALAMAILPSAASADDPKPATAPTTTAPPPRTTAPRLLRDLDVPYPEGAEGEATVELIVTVAADGTVRDATPTAAPADDRFTRAAVAALLAARFEPATRNGAPAAARIRMQIVFRPPAVVPEREAAQATAPGPAAKPAARKTDVQDVTVKGARGEPSRTVTLTRNEVRQIPGTFGDPFRAIEIMPGVTPVVTGLPFFFVRGAPPGNVGYYLDGVRVPLLFHVGIGPSVVHPALIERVDLYPGGYPAKYGRFSGGIVSADVAPPADEAHGEFNVRVFDAGALVETPFADKRGHALVGGRYSYTAAILSQLSPSTVLEYWDYQARATYDLTRDDRVGVLAFGSYDFLGQRSDLGTSTVFGTTFHRVDLRYDRRIDENGRMRVGLTTGFDRSLLPRDAGSPEDERSVRDRLVGARSDFVYRLSPRALLRAGTDMQMDAYDVIVGGDVLAPSQQETASLFPSRTDLSVGARGDVVLGVARGFEVTPGVRTDLYSSQGATAVGVDPRLAMRTQVVPRAAFLSALGIAHQAPSFVVPVPGFQPGGLRGGLQKAVQESAGVEVDLGGATIATATVFHNAFFDMSDPLGATPPEPSGCAPGTYPSDSIGGDRGAQPTSGGSCGTPKFKPGTIGPDRSGGGGQAADSRGSTRVANAFEVRTEGSSYGLELFLKRKLTSRVGGFVSYTLSRSERTANGTTYVATFDRTHVVNTAIAFDLGRMWRAGTRVTFYTGLPKLPDPSDDSTRLPSFFRIDLRLEKRWQLGKTWWLSAVAEWMNATLSKETVATTCTLQGCTYQTIGPVTIPSIGVEGGF